VPYGLRKRLNEKGFNFEVGTHRTQKANGRLLRLALS
jgi:hypothetical protein